MKWGKPKPGEAKMAGYNNLYEGTTGSAIYATYGATPDSTGTIGTSYATWVVDTDNTRYKPFRFKADRQRCPYCGVVAMLPKNVTEITVMRCPCCGAPFPREE